MTDPNNNNENKDKKKNRYKMSLKPIKKEKIKTAVSLDKDLTEQIINLKGSFPFSTYVNDVLIKWIENLQAEEQEKKEREKERHGN